MKNREGACTLVIVGKWNRYILNPGWVGKNIFDEEKIKVEFPVNNPDLPARYTTTDGIQFFPGNHRISFIAPTPYDDDKLIKICSMSRKLIEILCHTPLTGLGVNFGFEEKEDNFPNLEIFSLKDTDKYTDDDLTFDAIEIKRRFKLTDCDLNFSLIFAENIINLDFNFHYPIESSDKLIENLQDKLMSQKKETALGILNNIYKLELEEE